MCIYRNLQIAGIVVFSFLWSQSIGAMPTWPSRVPNGSVFSCATCHTSNIPERNPFGSAFNSHGRTWSATLAGLDSDMDGHTNGEELQDPSGSWTEGSPNPGDSSLVTNPGVPDNFPDATATSTNTPEPTQTATQTPTDTLTLPTATITLTNTVGPTETEGPGATATETVEPTETETAEPTETETLEPTQTTEPTETILPELTPTPTVEDGEDHVELEGALTSLDTAAMTFLVQGVLIRIDETTLIQDDDGHAIALNDLMDGDFVEVEGTQFEDGSVLAFKVEIEEEQGDDDDDDDDHHGEDDDDDDEGDDDDDDGECEEEFKGLVAEIHPASMTLVVGNVLLRASTSTEILDDDENSIPFSLLSVGDLVEVEYCPTAGIPPVAERIKQENDDESESREFEVEGIIEILDLEMTSLTVNGSLIFATGASIREEDGPEIELSDLMEGDFVKVRGHILPDSTIRATRIIRKSEDDSDCDSKVRGTLTLVDLSTSTISVGIIQIQVNDQTRIEDDRTDQPITLADLMVGDTVKVEFCSRMGVPIAVEIEVKEEDDYDLDDDGEVGEDEILEILSEISRGGVSLDLNGDNRTNPDDLITFSRRWKSRRN